MRMKIVLNVGCGTETFSIIFVRIGTHLVAAKAVLVGHQGCLSSCLNEEAAIGQEVQGPLRDAAQV